MYIYIYTYNIYYRYNIMHFSPNSETIFNFQKRAGKSLLR